MNFYDDATKMTKATMDNTLKSFAAVTKGFQQIATETSDFTKHSYELQASMFEKLMQAKSLDKTIEIQTEYAKTAYQDFVAQATKMNELYADIAKEAYKPYEATAKMAKDKAEETTQQVYDNAQSYAEQAA